MFSNPSEYSSYNEFTIFLFFLSLNIFRFFYFSNMVSKINVLLIERYHFTCWPFLLNDYNLKRTKHTCSEPNLLKHLYHKREFKATNTPVWWHSSSDVDGHEWIIMFIINLKLMSNHANLQLISDKLRKVLFFLCSLMTVFFASILIIYSL
jgi:hypothetical protein